MTREHWTWCHATIERLPNGVPWNFHVTEIQDDAVLNIYIDKEHWPDMRLLLGLGEADEQDGGYQTWFCLGGALALSLITPEEEDGLDGPDEPDDTASLYDRELARAGVL